MNQVTAGELSPSSTVQKNIALLKENKSCPKCDLSGANLSRFDLAGANLEGANLSRAKLSLSNLSDANLKNANLREAVFSGADLANCDLSGADLTGTTFIGAYISGAILDGEIVSTSPYANDDISNVKESVYVEDTVNSKTAPKTEEITIETRRDFEETPPPIPAVTPKNTASVEPSVDKTLAKTTPDMSKPAPAVKAAPEIQDVRIPSKTVEVVETPPQEIANTSINDKEIAEKKEPVAEVKKAKVQKSEKEIPQETATHKTVEPIVQNTSNDETKTDDQQQKSADTSPKNQVGLEEETGIVDKVLNMFTSNTPSTQVMKNAAILLDTEQCYGCDLKGINLSGENLDSVDLEGADLSDAILKDVDFEGANLKGVNFTNADLTGADLSEADLYKADFSGANLTDADFESALLDDVNFRGAQGYSQQSVLLIDAQ